MREVVVVRVTWKFVRETAFPAAVSMAREAGLDTEGWHLTDGDVPVLVTGDFKRHCRWSTARECAAYLQAWTDALAVVAAEYA